MYQQRLWVSAGIQSLVESLSTKSSLRLLDISDNGIGPKGAASLAAALEKLPGLAVLRLRGNCIGDEGAAALSSAMPGSGLQELDVGHNEVRRPLIELLPPPHSTILLSSWQKRAGCHNSLLMHGSLNFPAHIYVR